MVKALCLLGGVGLATAANHAMATEKATAREFRVADYGARGDGVADDSEAIRAAIADAIKAGHGATVLLGAKRYRVSSESKDGKGYCLHVRRASDLTIQGVNGKTEVVSASPAAGVFGFHSCTNACLRGVAIDYDPLPFTQGAITAVNVQQGTFDLKIDDGYPALDASNAETSTWGVVLNRRTRRLKPGTPSAAGFNSLTPLGGRKWRLKLNVPAEAQTMSPGDAFAMRRSMNASAAVFFGSCRGGTIEDVTEYAAASCCNVFGQCEGDIVTRRVTVMIRPGTTRLLSGNADGVHCQMVRKGLLMEDCRFEGMTDDGMNTYDRVRMVTEVVSPTELRVHETFNMRPGDRIQVMDPHSGLVRGEATVVSIVDKQQLIKFDRPIVGVRTTSGVLSGITSMTNARDADVVFNLSTCGAGYIVRRNYFGNFRGRGVILRGVHGRIEDNVFERTSGPGIVISNEPRWPEGPVPRDVVIRGNRFKGVGTDDASCLGAAIAVSADGLDGRSVHPGVKNIRLENNAIVDPPTVGILLQACEGVCLVGNRIEADNVRGLVGCKGIVLAACKDVRVDRLSLRYRRPGNICGIEIQPSVAAGDAGFTTSGVKAQLGPGVPTVLDRRVR